MKGGADLTRRDFLNGMALSLAAGTTLSPLQILARQAVPAADYYPPALTGLRGSHAGSFEVAHAISRAGTKYARPDRQTDDTYDLVVVGGGISGLAAARFFRDRAGRDVHVLVLDNHDDFGGHAKRNEFDVDGKTLVGYGGSQTIAGPKNYSRVSKKLLVDIGIDVERFYDFYDQSFNERWGLSDGLYFDRETYGVDRVLPSPLGGFFGEPTAEAVSVANIRRMPVSEAAQDALMMLMQGGVDYLDGKSENEKIAILRSLSFERYLQEYAGAPAELTALLRDQITPLWGVGWDALTAYEAAQYEHLGTWELGVTATSLFDSEEPYIHHFPDGNAGVARALVRSLLPDAIPGSSMESLATARARYTELDRPASAVRIRLNSTAVDVRHTEDGRQVDVTYVLGGAVYRVRCNHVVMACYNNLVPYLCPETPSAQVEALRYASKVPLAIGNVAIRNWRAFEKLGFHSFYAPGDIYFQHMGLDFPVSMGDYRFPASPDDPVVVQGWYAPNAPGRGLAARQQYDEGRRQMYEVTFDDFEKSIMRQFDGMLGGAGFDAERDIAAITVNRWPHGYAYEYCEIGEPADWSKDKGPHVDGRAPIGRISIANSDSSGYAYVNGAVDAADRAVNEQLASS